eukprot:gnl/MRDRNA2_/MRDRNA2_79431_c0_seq1.p1 gnl/MRDRNA2_/MRDRNA2_79431_c0~~gnl/MRDRNA2_/MRDRNA2_79431_c0_seq1.p1  ORF type:complete len:1085 (+),score=214.43 gnl/MRDRNA2_/MRDRNA2_79431_c0_seq1:114-3368(+)
MSDDENKQIKEPKPKKEPKAPKNLPACGFMVTATKKGTLPISIDKRAKGKKVTVISNVLGSAKSLVSALSSLLGVGGTSRQEASGIHWTVEVQGDQSERVSAALIQLGCVRGLVKTEAEKAKKKVVAEATRVCAYDKFLRKKDDKPNILDVESEYVNQSALVGAPCFKWHGWWPYCRGNCDEHMDLSDVWAENLHTCYECNIPTPKPRTGPMSLTEINMQLRSFGMLAEVGEAVKEGLQVKNGKVKHNLSRPIIEGKSLDEIRKSALAPGARLITDDPNDGKRQTKVDRIRARSQSASASRRARSAEQSDGRGAPPALPRTLPRAVKPRATDKPMKEGRFLCSICGAEFGLRRTLATHTARVHQVGFYESSCAAFSAPDQNRIPGYVPGLGRSPSTSKVSQAINPGVRRDPPTTGTSRASGSHSARSPTRPPVTSAVPIEPMLPQKPPSERVWATLLKTSRPLKDREQDQSNWSTSSSSQADLGQAWGTATSSSRPAPKSRKSDEKGRVQIAEFHECPWCGLECLADDIEAHVAQCLPEEDAGDGTLSDECHECTTPLRGSQSEKTLEIFTSPPGLENRWRAKENWSPTGEGMENMMKVNMGDEVALDWEQPTDEGGYWAYVYLVNDPNTIGYLPKKVLEKISLRREETASSTKSVAEGSMTTGGAEGKHLGKQHKKAEVSKKSSKKPDVSEKSSKNAVTEQHQLVRIDSSPANPSHGTEEDRAMAAVEDIGFPEEWLGTVLDLGFSESQSSIFWNVFENLRAGGESVEHSFLSAIEAGLGVQEECRAKEPPAKKQKPRGMQLSLEEHDVVYPSAIVTEDVSFVEVLKTSSLPSSSSRSRVPEATNNVDPSLSKCYKMNGKLCTGPCMFCRKALEGKSTAATASHPAERTPPEFSAPHSVNSEAYPAPHQIHSAPVELLECPVCDKCWTAGSIRMVDFESHVHACIAKAQSKAPSAQSHITHQNSLPNTSEVTEGISEEIRRWALEEINTLLDRFCFMKETDPVIVLSTLEACASSSAEMEAEACGLMHQNEPVKAFARKLWECRVAGSLQPVLGDSGGRGGKSGGKGQPAWGRGGGTRRGRWR